eukprot:GFKZ01010145.1.p1 GENE.GFKZ01010145.1~~GFKZ01010145.1.p1  ORF type:complete len:937 (+),score=121.83 GFKZ01010145.1:607-3417(+)
MAPKPDRGKDRRSSKKSSSAAKRSNNNTEKHSQGSPRMEVDRPHAEVVGPSAMASKDVKPISRPAFGRAGRPIKIETNFFKMSIPRKMVVSQYSVQILRFKSPESDDKRRRGSNNRGRGGPSASTDRGKEWIDVSSKEPIFFNRAVFSLFCDQYRNEIGTTLAFDGRSIAYAAREVNRGCLATNYELTIGKEGGPPTNDEVRDGKTEKVQVRIEHAKYLKFDDLLNHQVGTIGAAVYIAALDVVLSATPQRKYVQVGRSFYTPDGSTGLGRGRGTASAWRGFYQSARLSQLGLVLNVDESFTAFWNRGGRPLMDLIRDANDGREISCQDNRALKDMAQKFKALRIRASHTRITYKVHGFSNRGADRITFESSEDGRRVSIKDYFYSAYGITLSRPDWPCVRTNPKRDTYLPIEVLTVVENQRLTGLLSQEQTQGIVKIASRKPHIRREAAIRTMQLLNHSRDPVCSGFGVDVKPGLIKVDARVLPPPSIQYKDGNVRPRGGQWRPTKERYTTGALLYTWAVVNLTNMRDRDLEGFIGVLVSMGRAKGMTIANPRPRIFNCRPDKPGEEMLQIAQKYARTPAWCVEKYPLQFFLVIKERQDSQTYQAIKKSCDLMVGIASQVCLAKHCGPRARSREMYCDNLLLKINIKLGGQNFVVSPYNKDPSSRIPDVPFLDKPHIVLGADVTHPMAGGKSPSVAALVGSRDRQGVQFSGAIRNQTGKQEVILELGAMFKEVYYRWFQNFGGKWHVQSIIMFRDGVSDGQFEEVLQVELDALRQACREISDKFRPRITYIIVTKRHHARFFPDKENSDRSGNILPGTVIDRDITSREFYDFYLNSHAGIQGTSKPSKYTVLIDENNIPTDSLQGYVFRLSHAFVRCNRSVSMVNSAYYAHLLAFRGRAYIGEEMSDTASIGSSETIVPQAPALHNYLGKRLFFV